MRANVLTLNSTAESAIAPYRIVEFGVTQGTVKLANDANDKLMGISPIYAVAAGEPCDVGVIGTFEIEYGGTVARGDKLTTDTLGRAIVAGSPLQSVIGIALADGIVGDIGFLLVAQSSF